MLVESNLISLRYSFIILFYFSFFKIGFLVALSLFGEA